MSTVKIHRSFWLIAAFALIWNALGCVNFYMQITAGDLSFMPQWWRDVVATRPSWATGAMAVSVFGGALGGLLLLFRKSLAYYFFIMSLIGTIVTMSHAMGVSGAGPRQIFEGLLMPVVMSIVFIWYSKMVTRKGWIS